MPDEEFAHLREDLSIHHPDRLAEVDAVVQRLRAEAGMSTSAILDSSEPIPAKKLPRPMAKPKTADTPEELTDSVYCRRHRRSKPVPKGWADTCAYLCHRCYKALSAKERERYTPSSKPRMHANLKAKALLPEDHKPSLQPSIENPTAIPDTSPRPIPPKTVETTAATSPATPSPLRNCSLLSSLMPAYRIECKKCGKSMPCHHHWFANSRVLCPSCYSSMTEDEVTVFHQIHKNDTLPIPPYKALQEISESNEKTKPPLPPRNSVCDLPRATSGKPHGQEDSMLVSHRYRDETLRKMTPMQLYSAVKLGYLSRPRARIEMNRRRRSEYYDQLPDTPGVVA